jgi:hypothetical protein
MVSDDVMSVFSAALDEIRLDWSIDQVSIPYLQYAFGGGTRDDLLRRIRLPSHDHGRFR